MQETWRSFSTPPRSRNFMLPASAARLLPFLPPLLRALRVPTARPLDAAGVASPPPPAPASPRIAPIEEGAGLPLLSFVDKAVDFPYDCLNRLLARLDSGYATSFAPPFDILSPAVSCV